MNVPADWGYYYRTCGRGHRYHLSEGGCVQCSEKDDEEHCEQLAAEREVVARAADAIQDLLELFPHEVAVTPGLEPILVVLDGVNTNMRLLADRLAAQ